MRRAVAWAFTGGAHLLPESVEAVEALVDRGICVTAYVSAAGEEVLRMYGLLDRVVRACRGEYPREVVFEREEGKSFPRAARVFRGLYDAVVVSPATQNTCAKIAYGIADSLVSTLASLSLKARVRLWVVPTDVKEAVAKMPLTVDRSLCVGCSSCPPAESCSQEALSWDGETVRVNLLKCNGCGVCIPLCPKGSLSIGREVVVRPSSLNMEILEKIRDMPGVWVAESPNEVVKAILG